MISSICMCVCLLQTFGVMGGLYAAVNCFMLRLRQTQDGENLNLICCFHLFQVESMYV